MAIDYEKSLAALDEWLTYHASSRVISIEPTEKLFLEVLGKQVKLSRADDPLAVMAKFNIMLMRQLVEEAKKC